MGDRARGSAPAGAGAGAGASSSGIDWSIFKDGEDDAFGWLLRSAPGAAAAPVEPPLSQEILPLDDFLGHDDAALAALGGAPPADAAARGFSGLLRPSTAQAISVDGSVSVEDSEWEGEEEEGEEEEKGRGPRRGQAVKRAAKAGARGGKRPAKRSKAAAQADDAAQADEGGRGSGSGGVDRKALRREKNLVSVREFRKRKMKQLEQNEDKLRRLEAENMDLKMRLKIGKEALASEQREKQQIKEQMREMLSRGASEHEVAQFLDMYKVTYSDYGPRRREKLHFHLDRIRELLLPTQVTKLCLYSVEQGGDMIARDSVIREDPMAVPDSAAATMSLWGILAKELEVSEAQQRQILERREAIRQVRDHLNHTLGVVKQLEEVTDDKNTALEAQVAELQHILTPSQATRFIIWVKENPAFMYMLDKLVDSTLMTTTPPAEAAAATDGGEGGATATETAATDMAAG